MKDEEYIKGVVDLNTPSIGLKAKRYDSMVEVLTKLSIDSEIKEVAKVMLKYLQGDDEFDDQG